MNKVQSRRIGDMGEPEDEISLATRVANDGYRHSLEMAWAHSNVMCNILKYRNVDRSTVDWYLQNIEELLDKNEFNIQRARTFISAARQRLHPDNGCDPETFDQPENHYAD